MQFLPTLGFLVLIIQCGCIPIEIVSDVHLEEGPSLAAAMGARRVKKDAADGTGLDECSFVDSWREAPGSINVLAFLDASWEYSHRQATMLKMLRDRLENSGIKGLRFFVVNSAEPTATISIGDTEDEEAAWGVAEEADDQKLSKVERTGEALKEKIGPDIAFVQDKQDLRIWEKLTVSRDQVLVIDKCGRLTYRVIVPWSILHFPYVKAAILSTYKEQPCGQCGLETVETTTPLHVEESQTEDIADLIPENLTLRQMQEIVVKKYKLDQNDYTARKVPHGSESQDIPESIIKLLNGTANVKRENVTAVIENITRGSLNLDDSYVTGYTQAQISTGENKDANSQEKFVNGDSDTSTTTVNESGGNLEERRDKDKVNPDSEGTNETSSDSELWSTSTSSTEEQTDNYIQRTTQSSDENDYENDIMPIKIIMHAPHIHVVEQPCKRHEYLVLKFGQPEYHGHLDYDDDIASNDSRKDAVKDKYEAESGSGEIANDEDEQHRRNREEDRCKESIKGKVQIGMIFDKDESPGFYGEDSEYWRNFGNTAYQEEPGKDTLRPAEGNDAANITERLDNWSESGQKTEGTILSQHNSQPIMTAEDKDAIEEEELANNLFEHYSKLLPWLDYVID